MDVNNLILSFFASKELSILTAFLCWDQSELVKLSRLAYDQGMLVEICTDWSRCRELPPYDLHREGALLDIRCPNASVLLDQASQSRAFNLRYSWLLLDNGTLNITFLEDTLSTAAILPDGDVTWAADDGLFDVYRSKEDQPLMVSKLGVDELSRSRLSSFWALEPPATARRKDLGGIWIRVGVIVSQPQYFKGWADLTNRQIDTFSKVTYPLMQLAAEDMNFRINLVQVDLYGEEHNGSFDGLVGVLSGRRAELGIASMFMRRDRWRVLHFAAETVNFKSAFIFRQPTQASVTNVFVLPFARGVWSASGALVVASAALLAALAAAARALDPQLEQISLAEAVTFSLGVVCQQGFHLSPSLLSARLLMFSALTLALFSFTAYSAKIVSILQSPSNAIQTIDDLTASPLRCGVQETTYKKVYFAESKDPATQRLYKKKLLPLGDAAYLSVVDGIARVRTGLFAFSVEESPGYDIISKTFTNREKCGLHRVPAFNPKDKVWRITTPLVLSTAGTTLSIGALATLLTSRNTTPPRWPVVAVPIRKHSGYKELLATRLRWQRETGLLVRFRRIWMAEKPACDASGGDFVTVALRDVLPCVQVLMCGMALSVVLLFLEKWVHHMRNKQVSV